jgi:hypothetical protein
VHIKSDQFSKAKMRFQSFFMLMTARPYFLSPGGAVHLCGLP